MWQQPTEYWNTISTQRQDEIIGRRWFETLAFLKIGWFWYSSVAILKQTISLHKMMFVDDRSVRPELLALMMVVKFNETSLFFDVFELITKNLFSWMHERPERGHRVPRALPTEESVLKFRAISHHLTPQWCFFLTATNISRRSRNDSSSQF